MYVDCQRLSRILTVGSCEVGKRIVAFLIVHEFKHHVGVIDKRCDSETLDQHVLKVIWIKLHNL